MRLIDSSEKNIWKLKLINLKLTITLNVSENQ